jgi:hypothetical protein
MEPISASIPLPQKFPARKPASRQSSLKTIQIEPQAHKHEFRQVIMSLSNLQAGLTHVQNGLNELLRAYMQHTASVLAGENIAETLQLPSHITTTANAAIEAASTAANALTSAVTGAAPSKPLKRKREKKVKDPNAPKRPLTAMFLYASAAREIVKNDLAAALGPDEKIQPNAVNLEITKRWNEMADEDKEVSNFTSPSRISRRYAKF